MFRPEVLKYTLTGSFIIYKLWQMNKSASNHLEN